ncbi:hypothetical protein [Candidatus Electronema sp. JM]|uniref:hypothetical protein n=1 Tax=Candidatus Electronema sp. JM TaxID=3401571 RepID=UPI003AA8A6DA
MLDRALLYYRHVTGWAHGRRDYDTAQSPEAAGEKAGCTSTWKREELLICDRFFKAVQKEDAAAQVLAEKELDKLLQKKLSVDLSAITMSPNGLHKSASNSL